ncbi:MAG: replicative DNA helicase [Nitrospinae bacterium]|nr:replicative DNA helicase [Nitrospinota bacterium]
MAARTPPNDMHAEGQTLGAALLDNEAFARALEIIKGEEYFYAPKHRKIFAAMTALFEKSEPIDLVTLQAELDRRGELAAAGGIEYLAELVEGTPTAVNVGAHARIVREKHVLRRAIRAGNEIAERAYEEEGEIKEFLDFMERTALSIANDMVTGEAVIAAKLVTPAVQHIEKLYETKQLITGLPTGYGELDTLTGGLQPGNLVIVAGRPSMGKTAFALNVCGHACNAGKIAGVFSLEMTAQELVLRALCAEARVSGHRLRTGYLAKSDWPNLAAAAGRVHDWKMYVDDTASMTTMGIRAKARRVKTSAGGLDLIVVDYLGLITPAKGSENRVIELGEMTRSLKALAKELSCPVILISQLSRMAEEKADKRPELRHLRGSGDIEQDADVVLFVHREEFYTPDKAEAQGIAEIIIGKQRNGPLGTVRLAYLKEITKFENLERKGNYA